MPAPVLLFDAMGTLVHDPFFEEVPGFFGMTLAELIEAKHPTAWVEFERSEIDEEELFARFFADGRRVDGEGLKRAMRRAYRWLPGMEPLLQRLSALGVPMHALSNYPRWYEMIDAQLGISRYLRWSFVSCHTGVRKPHPRAYEAPIAALGGPPSRFVFVDDREDNCIAARERGMHAVVFEDARQLEARLAALNVLQDPKISEP